MLVALLRSALPLGIGLLCGWWMAGSSMPETMASPPASGKSDSLIARASRGGSGWLQDATLGTFEKERRLRLELAKAGSHDFRRLHQNLLEMPDTPERRAFIELLLDRWVKTAPKSAFEDAAGHIGLFYQTWARHDADAALASIKQVSPELSGAASAGLFRALSTTQPLQALGFRNSWTANGFYAPDIRTAYRHLAKRDIEAALVLFDSESSNRLGLAKTIASEWATTEPEQALAFARSLEGLDQRWALEGVLETWRPEDLEMLGALVNETNGIGSEDRQMQTSDVGKEVAIALAESHGAEAAIEWADSHLTELPKRYFYIDMVETSLDQGADAVEAWLGSIKDQRVYDQVIAEFVMRRDHPRRHLETMIEVLEAQPDASGQEALERMLRSVRAYPDIVERHGLQNPSSSKP